MGFWGVGVGGQRRRHHRGEAGGARGRGEGGKVVWAWWQYLVARPLPRRYKGVMILYLPIKGYGGGGGGRKKGRVRQRAEEECVRQRLRIRISHELVSRHTTPPPPWVGLMTDELGLRSCSHTSGTPVEAQQYFLHT